ARWSARQRICEYVIYALILFLLLTALVLINAFLFPAGMYLLQVIVAFAVAAILARPIAQRMRWGPRSDASGMMRLSSTGLITQFKNSDRGIVIQWSWIREISLRKVESNIYRLRVGFRQGRDPFSLIGMVACRVMVFEIEDALTSHVEAVAARFIADS